MRRISEDVLLSLRIKRLNSVHYCVYAVVLQILSTTFPTKKHELRDATIVTSIYRNVRSAHSIPNVTFVITRGSVANGKHSTHVHRVKWTKPIAIENYLLNSVRNIQKRMPISPQQIISLSLFYMMMMINKKLFLLSTHEW
jgi:hypothetical protein